MEHNDIYENLNVTSEMNFNCVVKMMVRSVCLSDVLPNFSYPLPSRDPLLSAPALEQSSSEPLSG
jgi:hypothetical protein